jgi:hypothetical protein
LRPFLLCKLWKHFDFGWWIRFSFFAEFKPN